MRNRIIAVFLTFLLIIMGMGGAAAAPPKITALIDNVSCNKSLRQVTVSGAAVGETTLYFFFEGKSYDSGKKANVTDVNGVYTHTFDYEIEDKYVIRAENGGNYREFYLDLSSGISNVSLDSSIGRITLSGQFKNTFKETNLAVYLMPKNKSPETLLEDLSELSHIYQIKTDKNGNYKHEFAYDGDDLRLALVISNGSATERMEIDTSASFTVFKKHLEPLYNLPLEYGALNGETVFERFKQAKAELPSEMPVLSTVALNETAIYVSVDALADGDGTLENPYTLKTAMKKLESGKGVTVYLRGGTYCIDETIKLFDMKPESPIAIASYPGEKAVITTGIVPKETAVDDSRIPDDVKPYIKAYSVETDLNFLAEELPVLSGKSGSYELAKWPNAGKSAMLEYTGEDGEFGVYDAGPYQKAADIGRLEYSRSVGKDGGTGFEIMLRDLRPFTWENKGDIYACGSFCDEYSNGLNVKVEEFDAKKRSMRTSNTVGSFPGGAKFGGDNEFVFINIPEELDAPGEWCFDSENKLIYVYPRTMDGEADFLLSLKNNTNPKQIFNISDCLNIVFDGIEFANTSAAPIYAENSTNIVVQNSDFKNVGAVCVRMRSCKYSGVMYSTFKDSVGTQKNDDVSVTFDDSTDSEAQKKLIPQRNFVQNSMFYNSGTVRVTGVGCIISHNVFSNEKSNSVTLNYGAENIVEYNEFIAGPTVSRDCGVIYLNGGPRKNIGHHIRYNYIHNSLMNRDGHYSIYLDEHAGNSYVYGNVIKDGGRIHMHGGSYNTVYNNVFVGNDAVPYTIWKDGKKIETTLPCINDSLNFYNAVNDVSEDLSSWSSWTKYWYSTLEDLTGKFEYLNELGAQAYDESIFYARYPAFGEYTDNLKKRAEEYRKNKSVKSEYMEKYADGTEVELNLWLAAPRENCCVNNVFINSGSEYALYISEKHALAENCRGNAAISDKDSYARGDFSDWSAVQAAVPDFEKLFVEKAGFTNGRKLTAEKPEPIYPNNNKKIGKSDLCFVWSGGVGSANWELEISEDESFESGLVYAEKTYQTAITADFAAEEGKTYYWRVCAVPLSQHSAEGSAISEIRSFTVQRNSGEQAVYISNPKFYENNLSFVLCNTDEKSGDIGKTNKPLGAKIIAAAYDEKGMLIKAEYAKYDFDASLQEVTVPLNNAEQYRVFVWDFSDDLVPMTKTLKK